MKVGDLIQPKKGKWSIVMPSGSLGVILKMHDVVEGHPETCLVQWSQPIRIFFPSESRTSEDVRGVYRTEWLQNVK